MRRTRSEIMDNTDGFSISCVFTFCLNATATAVSLSSLAFGKSQSDVKVHFVARLASRLSSKPGIRVNLQIMKSHSEWTGQVSVPKIRSFLFFFTSPCIHFFQKKMNSNGLFCASRLPSSVPPSWCPHSFYFPPSSSLLSCRLCRLLPLFHSRSVITKETANTDQGR